MDVFPQGVLEHARDYAQREVPYTFKSQEKWVLDNFFTNLDKKAYFMHSLPTSMGTVLLSMFSRIKNPRGLRGLFVDTFLPSILAGQLKEVEQGESASPGKFLKDKGIKNLFDFVRYPGGKEAFDNFMALLRADKTYLERITHAPKIKLFLEENLDGYGHNSIARMGSLWIGFEEVSMLFAKSLEWGRPGAGYIELSTRFVDMSKKEYYPIEEQLKLYGIEPRNIAKLAETQFEYYRSFQGENFSGPFPSFLREQYGHHFPEDKTANRERGVIGETCDVLGNFLPASTLTSLGVCVSGEAFPELIKHLMLDGTPENIALAEMIRTEAKKIGADQFIRHTDITPWKEASWDYLSTTAFGYRPDRSEHMLGGIIGADLMDRRAVERTLLSAFRKKLGWEECKSWEAVMKKIAKLERGKFDKLFNEFEHVSASFSGRMSFRGWRDVHRQGFCTHMRTHLTPHLGFYLYDKPAPMDLHKAFGKVHAIEKKLYAMMEEKGIPPGMMQYALSMGNLVGFTIAANLAQTEFCIWQRTGYNVNHEVRQMFLGMDGYLSRAYGWWKNISRADRTPVYVFARTEKGEEPIPLL